MNKDKISNPGKLSADRMINLSGEFQKLNYLRRGKCSLGYNKYEIWRWKLSPRNQKKV